MVDYRMLQEATQRHKKTLKYVTDLSQAIIVQFNFFFLKVQLVKWSINHSSEYHSDYHLLSKCLEG